MVDHVLVPVDQSEPSTTALNFALSVFDVQEVTAVHVLDPGNMASIAGADAYSPVALEELREEQEHAAEQVLTEAENNAENQDVTLETETIVGTPARAIVQYTDENDIDHIVIGSHGRSGASRVLLGSVAETVARRASVPVTIAR